MKIFNWILLSVIVTLFWAFTSNAQNDIRVPKDKTNNQPQIIDSIHPTAGVGVSAAFINGFPAVVYSDVKSRKLFFAIASNRKGTKWNKPVTISDTENTGIWCSLAEVNDRPAVAYYYHVPNDNASVLIYRRAADKRGNDWGGANSQTIVHRFPRTGKMVQMINVSGNPALVWFSESRPNTGITRPLSELYYSRATDINGQTWSRPIRIDQGVDSGLHPSIAIVNNRPAVAYFDRRYCGLKYVIARDNYGYSWNKGKIVSYRNGEIQGEYPSLAVVDGYPAIAFYNRTHNSLAYMRALDSFGKRWERARFIDKDNVCGVSPILAMNNDRPVVAYYARRMGSNRGETRFSNALDNTGLHWSSPTTVNMMVEMPSPAFGIINKSFAGVCKASIFTFCNRIIVVSRGLNNLAAYNID